MQLGKEVGTGFVSDDAEATVGEEVAAPPETADAQAPDASALPASEPEPTAAS